MAKKKKTSNVIKATIVTHYSKDDPNCDGDYYYLEIFVDGKSAADYGDYYHDQGCEKAEAFLEGVEYATGKKVKTTHKSVADADY